MATTWLSLVLPPPADGAFGTELADGLVGQRLRLVLEDGDVNPGRGATVRSAELREDGSLAVSLVLE